MEDIRIYDFKKSEKFSIENIRYLSLMSEEFCKTSNMQISYEAKRESFKLVLDRSSQITYSEFIEMVEKDSVVVEYKINPLVENLTLFVDKSMALTLVDLLLGGNGYIETLDRELTNIDLELFKYLVSNLIERIYIPYQYDNVEIVNIYTNTVQYQNVKNKDLVFKATIDAVLDNEIVGKMILCIPYKSMEPVINELTDDVKRVNLLEDDDNDMFSKEVFDFTKNVQVDICAKLGVTKVSINDLINLGEGDVILLDQRINDFITVSVGDADVYKARVGLLGIKKGIEITDIINRER